MNAGRLIPKKIINRFLGSHVGNYQNATSCIQLVSNLQTKPLNESKNGCNIINHGPCAMCFHKYHAQTNITMTVGIAFSPPPVRKQAETKAL